MALSRRTIALGIGVVVLALVPPIAAVTNQPFYLDLFRRMMIFAIAAVSLDLILGYGGMVSFGHAAYLGIGGYIVGVAIAYFAVYATVPPEWRLFVITGFCGGLTTFSTFSAELVTLMQQGRALWALGAAAAHLMGSVVITFAGIGTVLWLRSLRA